jgi:hypothetical protein
MLTRPQTVLFLAAFAVLGTGCSLFSEGTTANTTTDNRPTRLPTGVTLLESDRSECEGSVAIDESWIANARRADLVVQRGGNATFEIDVDEDEETEIEWTCVGAADTELNSVECPELTSHLRVTRAASGDDVLLECYGDTERVSTRRARN